MWPLKIVASVVVIATVAGGAVLLAQRAAGPAGAAGGQEVAALKQALQEGLKKIRQYEWVETTIISLKGEEKARTQNRCYYGAEGKVQKISLEASPAQAAPAGGGGRRGGRLKARVIENKKEEMQDYMQRAAALIHRYVPPDGARIEAAKAAGRIAADPGASKGVRLVVSQYLLPGDSLTIGLDPATKRLLGLSVNTYLDKPDETVALDVQMNTLPDGALYAAQTTLDAKARNIRVVVQNSGYRPAQR